MHETIPEKKSGLRRPKMFGVLLVPLLTATLTTALPSSLGEATRARSLQEVLLKVSESYRELGQEVRNLSLDISKNMDRAAKSMDQAETSDKSLQQAMVNAQRDAGVWQKILDAICPSDKGTTTEVSTTTATVEPPSTTESGPFSGDCAEMYAKGQRLSGSYVISLQGVKDAFTVFCDMETDGGGWTVFQRRGDFGNPEDYFYRDWAEYKNGFGDTEKEFWLGNDLLSALTQQKNNTLRVDLEDMQMNKAHAQYSTFKVENEEGLYRLTVGGFSGNADDSLSDNNGMAFTTKDRSNDRWVLGNCAERYRGAWWYELCGYSNLNGPNLRGRDKEIFWYRWKGTWASLSSSEMKLRPSDF